MEQTVSKKQSCTAEVCLSVLELQEQRVVCYNTLEQAFQEFVRTEATLSSGQQFMRVCQQVKVSFLIVVVVVMVSHVLLFPIYAYRTILLH